jgi:hypothetical protein
MKTLRGGIFENLPLKFIDWTTPAVINGGRLPR